MVMLLKVMVAVMAALITIIKINVVNKIKLVCSYKKSSNNKYFEILEV